MYTWEKRTALSQSDLEVKYLTYGQKCSVISWETFILHSWFSCIVIALDLLTFVHFLDSLRSTCSDSSGTGCLCRTCGLACHCLSCLHQESRKSQGFFAKILVWNNEVGSLYSLLSLLIEGLALFLGMKEPPLFGTKVLMDLKPVMLLEAKCHPFNLPATTPQTQPHLLPH